MKKFFEKHDLVKLSGFFMILTALLTWLVSNNSYSAGELVTDEMLRVGIFDISTYGLLGFYYFTVTFMFVIIVAGFYKFVGSTEAYSRLTDKFAHVFEGKEKVFVAISILVYACLAGISTEQLVLLAFIPFTISILAKLKVDKVTGLLSTFGGVLIGVLGSTYSSKIVGQMVTSTTVQGLVSTYNYEAMGIGVIFALAYILLVYFVFARLNKTVKEEELLVDPFITNIPEAKVVKKGKKVIAPKKVKVLPLAITLLIVFVIIAMAFTNWEAGFGVTVFKDVYNWIKTATLFDQPIYSYLLGNMFVEFGKWDLFGACAMLFIATLIIKVLYRVPLDNILGEYGEGFKKISKTIVVLVIVYNTLVLSFVFPTISYFIDQIISLGENLFTLFIGGVIASVFAVDYQFVFGLVGNLFATFQNTELAAFILQLAYGFVGFIAPTSAILMLGLSMLDIKFKDYFKGIWKFLLALLIVIFVVLAILMYV